MGTTPAVLFLTPLQELGSQRQHPLMYSHPSVHPLSPLQSQAVEGEFPVLSFSMDERDKHSEEGWPSIRNPSLNSQASLSGTSNHKAMVEPSGTLTSPVLFLPQL